MKTKADSATGGQGEGLADVMPLRPSRTEEPDEAEAPPRERVTEVPSWHPPDNEALDLLDVAGLPILKRAVPAAAALIAVLFVLFGLRLSSRPPPLASRDQLADRDRSERFGDAVETSWSFQRAKPV